MTPYVQTPRCSRKRVRQDESTSAMSTRPEETFTVAATNTSTEVINGVPVDDLFATITAIRANSGIASFKFRVRNQWQNAARNTSTVEPFYAAGQDHVRSSPFVLEADEPQILFGNDTAANPAEYLLHSLAACLTTSMVYHAAVRGIEIQEIESVLEGGIDLLGFIGLDKNVRQGYQGIHVHFKIKADVPDEQLEKVVQLGQAHSPVFDSLTNGVPVCVTSERL